MGAPGAGPAVLHSTHHVLLRTRCSAFVEDLTLLRLGDEVGYPNAVVYAEAGSLTMRGCRITCGGPAPSVEHALRVFHGFRLTTEDASLFDHEGVLANGAVPRIPSGQIPPIKQTPSSSSPNPCFAAK